MISLHHQSLEIQATNYSKIPVDIQKLTAEILHRYENILTRMATPLPYELLTAFRELPLSEEFYTELQAAMRNAENLLNYFSDVISCGKNMLITNQNQLGNDAAVEQISMYIESHFTDIPLDIPDTYYAAPAPAPRAAATSSNTTNYYQLAQLSCLAAMLKLSLSQSSLNLESAAALAKIQEMYQEVVDLLSDLQSFITTLNAFYKNVLAGINNEEYSSGSTAITQTIHLGDTNKILNGLVQQVFAEHNSPNTNKVETYIGPSDASKVIKSITINSNGSVTCVMEEWWWVSGGSSSSMHDDQTNNYPTLTDAINAMRSWLRIDSNNQFDSSASPHQGSNPIQFIIDLEEVAAMQTNNCFYIAEVPGSMTQYFPKGSYGYQITVDSISQMMHEMSIVLAVMIPNYTETTFVTDWGENILTNTGCEQMLGTISGMISQATTQVTTIADKVGLLQDKVNLARELISSFINLLQQITNF